MPADFSQQAAKLEFSDLHRAATKAVIANQ